MNIEEASNLLNQIVEIRYNSGNNGHNRIGMVYNIKLGKHTKYLVMGIIGHEEDLEVEFGNVVWYKIFKAGEAVYNKEVRMR